MSFVLASWKSIAVKDIDKPILAVIIKIAAREFSFWTKNKANFSG